MKAVVASLAKRAKPSTQIAVVGRVAGRYCGAVVGATDPERELQSSRHVGIVIGEILFVPLNWWPHADVGEIQHKEGGR